MQRQDDFNKGLEAYFQKDYITAAGHIKKVLELNPNDTTAERYLKNAAKLIVNGVSEDWTGVERMTSK